MNVELLEQVAYVAVAGSIVTTATMQQIKSGINVKNSKTLVWISLAVSCIIGTAFSLSFSTLSITCCIWSSFFTWLGADGLYKLFEEKIFKPYSQIQEEKKQNAIELKREEE